MAHTHNTVQPQGDGTLIIAFAVVIIVIIITMYYKSLHPSSTASSSGTTASSSNVMQGADGTIYIANNMSTMYTDYSTAPVVQSTGPVTTLGCGDIIYTLDQPNGSALQFGDGSSLFVQGGALIYQKTSGQTLQLYTPIPSYAQTNAVALTLDYGGRLYLKGANNTTVWTSPNAPNTINTTKIYTLGISGSVLQINGPRGTVAWSRPLTGLTVDHITSGNTLRALNYPDGVALVSPKGSTLQIVNGYLTFTQAGSGSTTQLYTWWPNEGKLDQAAASMSLDNSGILSVFGSSPITPLWTSPQPPGQNDTYTAYLTEDSLLIIGSKHTDAWSIQFFTPQTIGPVSSVNNPGSLVSLDLTGGTTLTTTASAGVVSVYVRNGSVIYQLTDAANNLLHMSYIYYGDPTQPSTQAVQLMVANDGRLHAMDTNGNDVWVSPNAAYVAPVTPTAVTTAAAISASGDTSTTDPNAPDATATTAIAATNTTQTPPPPSFTLQFSDATIQLQDNNANQILWSYP